MLTVTNFRNFLLVFAIIGITSCKKDISYIYGVNDSTVNQPGVNKPNVKSTLEFISIAYSDLFGTSIGAGDLTDLSLCYVAFGDKKFTEDLIIRNFLNNQSLNLTSASICTPSR